MQTENNFPYDVFVSYRQREPDLSWTRTVLLPELEKNGLKVCIDFKCFRLGASLIKEMEKAVEQSRYTLAVLSPAYLQSHFTELENLLSEHLGLENSQRRLLAVMREPCKPRLSMRSRLWLDVSDEAKLKAGLPVLIEELLAPPDL